MLNTNSSVFINLDFDIVNAEKKDKVRLSKVSKILKEARNDMGFIRGSKKGL